MQFLPLLLFVAVHLKNCFLLPSCHLTLMSFCTEGLPGVAESIINSGIFPHGFCDFAFGFTQNDSVEGMLRKKKFIKRDWN